MGVAARQAAAPVTMDSAGLRAAGVRQIITIIQVVCIAPVRRHAVGMVVVTARQGHACATLGSVGCRAAAVRPITTTIQAV